MKTTDTRAIIEAGFLTAIVVIIDILATTVPVFGIFGTFLTPVTIAVLTLRRGYKWGFLSAISSFFILVMYLGPLMALPEAVVASIGIVLGIGYRSEWRPRHIMLAASVAFTLMLVIMYVIVWLTTELNVLAQLDEAMVRSVQNSIAMYREMGMSEEQLKQFEDLMKYQFEAMRTVFFSLFYCSSIFGVYIMARITEFIAKRTGTPVAKPMDPVETWRVPKEIVLIFILGFIGQYWANKEGWTLIGQISQNILTVTLLILTVQAISFVWFICKLFHFNKMVSIILVLLIIMVPTITITAAIIDLYSPYRKKLLELRDVNSRDE